MKQIPLLQGKVLLIELPEGTAMECVLHNKNGQNYLAYFENLVHRSVKLPPGNWHIIGILSEVTESEASKLVKYTGLGGYVDSYENYQNKGYLFLSTAIKSLESSILAEGYYLDENPHGDEPKPENTPNYAYSVDVRIWEATQSRVLDRSRCLLLGRDGV